MCIELLDTENPKAIWKEGAKQLADNLEVTASLRYLILEALHATLYFVQKGIAHRDLKWPHHLGRRIDTGQLVVFDLGLAEQNGKNYSSTVEARAKNLKTRQRNSVEPIIKAGCTRAQAETTQHRFKAGTDGYRPPFEVNTQELGHFADIWSGAASLLRLIRKRTANEARDFEKKLHAVVQRQNFDEFVQFALEGKDQSQMKDSCRRLLKLAFQMFQSTPFDGMHRFTPEKAITTALFSEFALCYIFEEQELEKRLCEKGIVIDGKLCKNGKMQRPVLLIKHGTLGLLVLTIFRSKANDPACDYFGRRREVSTGGESLEIFPTRRSVCTH
jgi:serine/threonine protein kinase